MISSAFYQAGGMQACYQPYPGCIQTHHYQ